MENLNEFIYINDLYSVYGETLTAKQKEMMESYYVYNLSIQEIADQLKVSKAAVSDALKVSVKHLENLESIVGHIAYKKSVRQLLEKIKEETQEPNILALITEEEQDGIWIINW